MSLKQIVRKITTISNLDSKGEVTSVSPEAMRCSPPQAPRVSQWREVFLPMQEVWVDPLEKKRATHSNILAQEILLTEPGGLQSMGSQKVKNSLGTKQLMLSLVRLSTPQYLLNHES